MENVIRPEHILRDQLLQVIIDNRGSDLFLTVGTFPAIKIAGEISSINQDIEILTYKDTREFAESLISEKQHEKLVREQNLDFSFSFNQARFRGNISFQMNAYMIVIRLLNAEIPDIDSLGLTDIYREVTLR